ncbi:MAG: outer membrane beta-barrel protein [Burkholderiales bacterium]|nr:outer membrane beta-barrel protein [Burkholderiales bacterium]
MKFIAALALAAAVSTPALAEGFYAGADLGRSKLEVDVGNGYTASTNASSYSIFAGYQFNKNFGAEIGYRDLGKKTFATDTLKANATQISLIASVPLSNEFDLFGRIGIASLEAKDNSGSETKSKAVYGVGARYAVTKEFGIRGEYDQYDKWDGATFSVWSIGGDYRF